MTDNFSNRAFDYDHMSDLFKNNFNELTPKELKKVNKKEVILYGADILEISDPPQKYLLSDTSSTFLKT